MSYWFFKKASELSTICGTKISVVVFSLGKKVYWFGYPFVELVVDWFLAWNLLSIAGTLQLFEAHRSANIHELTMELTLALKALKAEKKQGETLQHIKKENQE